MFDSSKRFVNWGRYFWTFAARIICIEIAASFTVGELLSMTFRRWVPAFAGMTLMERRNDISINYEHWSTVFIWGLI